MAARVGGQGSGAGMGAKGGAGRAAGEEGGVVRGSEVLWRARGEQEVRAGLREGDGGG